MRSRNRRVIDFYGLRALERRFVFVVLCNIVHRFVAVCPCYVRNGHMHLLSLGLFFSIFFPRNLETFSGGQGMGLSRRRA